MDGEVVATVDIHFIVKDDKMKKYYNELKDNEVLAHIFYGSDDKNITIFCDKNGVLYINKTKIIFDENKEKIIAVIKPTKQLIEELKKKDLTMKIPKNNNKHIFYILLEIKDKDIKALLVGDWIECVWLQEDLKNKNKNFKYKILPVENFSINLQGGKIYINEEDFNFNGN